MAKVCPNYIPLFCILYAALVVASNSQDELLDVRVILPEKAWADSGGSDKCLVQLHASLEKLRKRQATSRVASLIDLSGYALHQSLRNAPLDMYVTDIKIRAPSVGSWVQVQKCQFSRHAEMRTHLLFNDLLVSGVVRLLPGNQPIGVHQSSQPPEHCTMTLRLRRAGLDLRAAPDLGGGPKMVDRGRGIQVRTESNFIDPHFLSVHAYGCRFDQWARDGWLDFPSGQQTESRRFRSMENNEEAEIRIISLGTEPELEESDENELYRQRILSYTTPRDKLAAVLSIKKQIANQANALFQTHGPFSQQSSQLPLKKPIFTSHHDLHELPAAAASTITELDEDLRPIRPVSQVPFHALLASTTSLPNLPLYSAPSPPLQDVSSEMEDIFLRGAKALLSKYLEKQLEVPIKEALMTKIGYTVSYG